jgi:serine/threonine-protein kinase
MSPSPTRLCPKCAGEVRDGWRVCPACATRLDAAATETIAPSPSSSSSVEEGRFPAGTVLAGRYRVMGLIGAGGMGEVYRAYDLILNQQVALKFLVATSVGEASLARFRNEVRIARQVSHPNVCRVYDLGVVEGLHFLSMEYIDGEDLDSLLRRIGRLPADKAIEFTRKICAGLAAAHERGVLHRDLKPKNVMIDGRGQVRITDFGLAALAAEVALGDIRSGTPAYMAPEQKAGKEVTTRSDIYSLGLVLYEMFTGKKRSQTQSSPSEHVKDLDPAIERVILRCLEEDPRRRPSTALSVAMALPGGDPIAAALAAGETPSPEMVAASGEKEGFSPRTAGLCFAGLVAVLAVGLFQRGFASDLLRLAPLAIPPDGLAFQAQQVLRQLGYTEEPRRAAYGFNCCDGGFLRRLEQYDLTQRDAILASHQPAVVRFWYRQHQGEIWADPNLFAAPITYGSPPNIEPGMIRLNLDAKGRLVTLEVRPSAAEDRGQRTEDTKTVDWGGLLAAAGLDAARFSPAEPQAVPPMAVDARMAWTGTYAEGRTEQIRVEAAAWQGRPVFFRVDGDWRQPVAASGPPAVRIAAFFVFLLMLAGSALLARHNFRLGRGDRRGAAWTAGVVFLGAMSFWALDTAHAASFWELRLLIEGLAGAGFVAALVWALYMAIEPYMRRHWPDALISWTRLQAGRYRDTLVASHVLAGLVLSQAVSFAFVWTFFASLLEPRNLTLPFAIGSLESARATAAGIAALGVQALIYGIGLVFVVVLLRLLLRRAWIADALSALLITSLLSGPVSTPAGELVLRIFFLLTALVLLWLLRRFGLLAVLAATAAWFTLATAPGDLTTWYAGRTALPLLLIVIAAAWATWVITSAQRRTQTESTG